MSKRGFADRLAIETNIGDNAQNPVASGEYDLENIARAIEDGNIPWKQNVMATVAQLQESGATVDFVTNPEDSGWSLDGFSEGIGKRLDAALTSWRMDAGGGGPVSDDAEGGVVWGAGWSVEDATNPSFGADWRKYIVLCSVNGENDSINVDPRSVAVFVAGREAQLEGGDEWTLFTGGEELANEVAVRIGGDLIVNEVNKVITSGIGSAALAVMIDHKHGRGNNYEHHTVVGKDEVAEVTYSRDFGSSSLRELQEGGGTIAYSLFQDAIAGAAAENPTVSDTNQEQTEPITYDKLHKLLNDGIDVRTFAGRLSSELIYFNLDELLERGADANILIRSLEPYLAAYHLDKLIKYGANIDPNTLIPHMSPICIVHALGNLIENGAVIDFDKIVNGLSPMQIAENLDKLIKYGANIDVNTSLIPRLSPTQISHHLDMLVRHGAVIGEDKIAGMNLDEMTRVDRTTLEGLIKSLPREDIEALLLGMLKDHRRR